MKMSNFENPTWRTAAILKIVIAPYLTENRPNTTKFVTRTQILTQSTEMWEKFRNSRIQDGGRTPYWQSFFGNNSAPYGAIETKFGMRRHNHTRTTARCWKYHFLENPTWRTAAILKVIISPYLSHKVSNLTKLSTQTQILSQAMETCQKIRNSQIQDGGRTPFWNSFLLITRLHRVRLIRNLQFGGITARTRRLGDENVQFRKSNIWHTAAFLKKKSLYLHISVANRPNFDTAEESMQT